MTSWHEAHQYMAEQGGRDDEPPPCPGCVAAERKAGLYEEELSEAVLDVLQPDGSPALMRGTPNLPEVVVAVVAALQNMALMWHAYVGEQNWDGHAAHAYRQAADALAKAGVKL